MKKIIIMVLIVLCLLSISFVEAESNTSFDIVEYQNKMNVGDTQFVQISIYPSDADVEVKYRSASSEIAEISSGGKIIAKKKGTTQIIIEAGGTIKKLDLTVIVNTDGIHLENDYVVINQGDTAQIYAEVYPKDAVQKLTYRSTNTKVAKVDSEGNVEGIGSGYASIIISNGEKIVSATVIVNRDIKNSKFEDNENKVNGMNVNAVGKKNDLIFPNRDFYTVNQIKVVDNEMLSYLESEQRKITITSELYEIIIDGKKLVNCKNEMDTRIQLEKKDKGIEMVINEGNPLPGLISIKIKEVKDYGYRYLYLYDIDTQKYQLVDKKISDGCFFVDLGGRYYLTYEKIREPIVIEKWVIISTAFFIIVLIIASIVSFKYSRKGVF